MTKTQINRLKLQAISFAQTRWKRVAFHHKAISSSNCSLNYCCQRCIWLKKLKHAQLSNILKTYDKEVNEVLHWCARDIQAICQCVGQKQQEKLVVWEANAVVNPAISQRLRQTLYMNCKLQTYYKFRISRDGSQIQNDLEHSKTYNIFQQYVNQRISGELLFPKSTWLLINE